MKRNFRKRFRGLFLTVSLAACGCGNHVVESKSFKTDIAKLVILIFSFVAIDKQSEKMIKKFIEDKIDEFSKNILEKLDEDNQKNNQEEKKERVYEKVAQILKNYLAEVANGSYKRLVWKVLSHYSKIKNFQKMKNKNLGTANIIWCVLSLKYHDKFDSEMAQKDKEIQDDLLKIINDIVDIVAGALLGEYAKVLTPPLKEYIKKRAAIDGDWIAATSGFLGAVQAFSDMPPPKGLSFVQKTQLFLKILEIQGNLTEADPEKYKFENYKKEDFWKGWEDYY